VSPLGALSATDFNEASPRRPRRRSRSAVHRPGDLGGIGCAS